MIKIVIDQGNSAIKYGIFDKDKLILAETADGPDQNRLREVISDYQPEAAIISSVREPLDLSSLPAFSGRRSEEHTSELQSRPHLVCRLLLEKKKKNTILPPVSITNP